MIDTIHTPEQKTQKLHGLFQKITFIREQFLKGNLKSYEEIKHELDSLNELSKEAERCIKSVPNNE